MVNQALKGTEKGLLFINIWKLCTEDFPVEGQKKWSESETAFELIQIFFNIIVVGKNQNLILDERKKIRSTFLGWFSSKWFSFQNSITSSLPKIFVLTDIWISGWVLVFVHTHLRTKTIYLLWLIT